MYGNDFWRQVEITPDRIVHENDHFVVVVTPRLWREQARSETDRQLGEYSLVNKMYRTIETTHNVLSTMVQYADTMSRVLVEVTKQEEPVSAQIVRMLPKDSPK